MTPKIEAMLLLPAPVDGVGPPVVVAVVLVVTLLPPVAGGPWSVKLAQVMRVLLLKWRVMERFPKNEPKPLTVLAKSSL
jgi:hypothetical protein